MQTSLIGNEALEKKNLFVASARLSFNLWGKSLREAFWLDVVGSRQIRNSQSVYWTEEVNGPCALLNVTNCFTLQAVDLEMIYQNLCVSTHLTAKLLIARAAFRAADSSQSFL